MKPNPTFSQRVNPARAGMIRPDIAALSDADRKPRASGDDPTSQWTDGTTMW